MSIFRHGDSSEDSHLELAGLHRSRAGLDSLELVPFRHLIQQGVSGVMTGHLSVPALENDARLPASQSAAVIKGLLKNELGFDGLCIRCLVMKGASGQSGEIYSGFTGRTTFCWPHPIRSRC
jgi:beta-glucosidase-like glycosyl hydrolase